MADGDAGEPPETGDEVERLRREADAILTRYAGVQDALESARGQEGDHWDEGSLDLALDDPTGGTVEVTVDLDADPGSAAERRYDRAKRLEARLAERAAVDDRLAGVPPEPVAYLVCFHLDAVGSDYPRSMAGYLKADREDVVETCEALREAGPVERIESGTVKRRNAKAKRSEEVRQHHTYYRLSREGDHLLRWLGERDGKANVLRHLPGARRLVERVAADGPTATRAIAAGGEEGFAAVRRRFEALRRVGLLTTVDGVPDEAGRSDDDAAGDAGGTPTYYATTPAAERILDDG